MPDIFLDFTAWVIPVLVAVLLHEIAHGWVAEKFGDDTARRMGRITLNPIKHIDRWNTIGLPFLLWLVNSPVLFGAAKPVPVNFNRLNPRRLGMAVVALAGPATNVILAIISALLLHIEAYVTPEDAPWLYMNLYRLVMLNCVLAAFNMIPILPLDGGRVVYAMLPHTLQHVYGKLERIGVIGILLLLIVPTMLGYSIVQETLLVPPNWLLTQIMTITGNNQ